MYIVNYVYLCKIHTLYTATDMNLLFMLTPLFQF